MNIFYDLFDKYPHLVGKTTLDEDIMLKALLLFVADVLQPLREEIELEENIKELMNIYAGTVICLLEGKDFAVVGVLHQQLSTIVSILKLYL